MEAVRAARVERRKILGDYYRNLANNYDFYWQQRLSYIWPIRPNVPLFEND